jgi:predicted GNAT superfamily acetyltransferase
MTLIIRPLQTETEYRAAEQLQRDVWGMDDVEIVAHDLLITVHKNGGLVLGAFETKPGSKEKLVGFVFGFVGFQADGRAKHCSHLAGVAPAYQGRNIGYSLKLAQREYVLAQGIDLITWTFEPLESRNAHFNLHKLGATCSIYLRNVYGAMRDKLNAGLPSDRFQVDWRIKSARVEARLKGEFQRLAPSALQAAGAVMINRAEPVGELLWPAKTIAPAQGSPLLVQIPADFQKLRAADKSLARAWRSQTRQIFEAAFSADYIATDLLFENGASYYLLELGQNQGESLQNLTEEYYED